EMMIADIRAMRIACLIRHVPELYANWKDALREAMEHVDEPTRAVAEELLHDVLASIADARAAAAAEPPSAAAPPPPNTGERTRRSGRVHRSAVTRARSRAMFFWWPSIVPPPISSSLASRHRRSTRYSPT